MTVEDTAPTGAIDNPPTEESSAPDGLGGDCLCGRGLTIGTCIVSANRLMFRAFHEPPAVYHWSRVTDWACVDCVADAALDIANGVIREQMLNESRHRAEEMDALVQANAMRREAGLPLVPAVIPEGCDEWPTGGER
jgi:hypothetical protein